MNSNPSLSSFLVAILTLPLLAACGGGSGSTPPTADASSVTASQSTATASSTPVPLEGGITVFAASSLTDAFNELAKAFHAANPKATATFNFASSSALAVQINQGAPADVFASADTVQMKVVTDAGNVSESQLFARNLPVVVVPKSAAVVASFQDLAKPGLKLVLASKDVPIGNYARTVFTNASAATGGISADFSARVLANLKSEETNVRAVLAKIQVGEADAGIVYATDAVVAGSDVRTLPIPTQYNVVATYPIAVVKSTKQQAVARAFVAFVLSVAGQAILQKYGFVGPASQ